MHSKTKTNTELSQAMGSTLNNRSTTTEPKIVSEYDQEIPQSQTALKPMAPRVNFEYTLQKLFFCEVFREV